MSGDKIIILEKGLSYKIKDFLVSTRYFFLIISIFLIGFSIGIYSTTLINSPQKEFTIGEDTSVGLNKFSLGISSEEKPSPSERITEDQIHVYNNKVTFDIENPEWATFTDTNSMDPVLDKGAYAIEIVPKSVNEIQVGDIASYKSQFSDGTIIHRVIEIGTDEDGWFAKFKGDNNADADPGKIRFNQIQRVVVAIIY